MVGKFPGQVSRKSWNCWISEHSSKNNLARLSSFPELTENHVAFVNGNFPSSYRNFSSQGKRPWFENFQWRMKQHFSKYSKKETTWSRCSPKFQAISYPEFSFHLIFVVKVCEIFAWILRFCGNWTAFWKFCVGNQMISSVIWNKGRHTQFTRSDKSLRLVAGISRRD